MECGGRPGTRTRMGYPTRPSNVRVYQFRQPPLLRRRILRCRRPEGSSHPPRGREPALGRLAPVEDIREPALDRNACPYNGIKSADRLLYFARHMSRWIALDSRRKIFA